MTIHQNTKGILILLKATEDSVLAWSKLHSELRDAAEWQAENCKSGQPTRPHSIVWSLEEASGTCYWARATVDSTVRSHCRTTRDSVRLLSAVSKNTLRFCSIPWPFLLGWPVQGCRSLYKQNPSRRCPGFRAGLGTKTEQILVGVERPYQDALIRFGRWKPPRSHEDYEVPWDAGGLEWGEQ